MNNSKMKIWTIGELPKGKSFEFWGDLKTKLNVGDVVQVWTEKSWQEDFQENIYGTAVVTEVKLADCYIAKIQ